MRSIHFFGAPPRADRHERARRYMREVASAPQLRESLRCSAHPKRSTLNRSVLTRAGQCLPSVAIVRRGRHRTSRARSGAESQMHARCGRDAVNEQRDAGANSGHGNGHRNALHLFGAPCDA